MKTFLLLKHKKIVVLLSLFFILFTNSTIFAERKEKSDIQTNLKKAEELFYSSKYKEAIEKFKQVLSENNTNFIANKKLGLSYLRIGNINEAISYLRLALQIERNDKDILMALADAYVKEGNFIESIKLYKRLVGLEPNNVWFRYKLAEVLSWAQKYSDSINGYITILDLEPDNSGVRINLSEVYAWKGIKEKDSKLFKKAVIELKKVILKEPRNTLALKKLGWVYIEMQKLTKAVNILERALYLNSVDTEIKRLLAKAYTWSGEFTKAIKIYDTILKEDPNDIGALYMLGNVYAYSKKYDKSLNYYNKILELDPKNLGAKIGIAQIYAYNWENKKARISYNEILKENPKNIGAILGLAELEQLEYHWEEAVNKYKEVLTIDPSNNLAYEKLKYIDSITSPSLDFKYVYFSDSDHFVRSWWTSIFDFRPFENTLLLLEFHKRRFHVENLPSIYRNDYSFKINQHISNFLDIEINAMGSDYSNDGRKNSIQSLSKINLKERVKIYLSCAKNMPIEDSILTINESFSKNVFGIGLVTDHFWGVFLLDGGFLISKYSDDNKRLSKNIQFSYKFFKKNNIYLRLKYDFLDFSKQISSYWTPINYETYSFILDWEHQILKNFSLGLNGTKTYFSKDDKWGYGFKGFLDYRIKDSLNVRVSGTYFDADTEDPWLGEAYELKISYLF